MADLGHFLHAPLKGSVVQRARVDDFELAGGDRFGGPFSRKTGRHRADSLTNDPAYDDQAAFSPDSKQVVLVSTREGGVANLWSMDLLTSRAKRLTSGAGGDFRPSRAPDGKWIAFSSGRGKSMPFVHGRWQRLQLADLYMIHPDAPDCGSSPPAGISAAARNGQATAGASSHIACRPR